MASHRVIRALVSAALAAAAASWVGGCASAPAGNELLVPPGRYAEAFDAAKESLRDARFMIDRVDARAGVITTGRKKSLGALSPWDAEISTFDAAAFDLLHRNRRAVRVTFEPADRPEADPELGGDPAVDVLAAQPSALVMRVQATVVRENRVGRRLESSSMRLNTTTTDPALARRGMSPTYHVALERDPELEAKVVAWVRERIGEGAER